MKNNNELSVCGYKAVFALFKKNPDRISRLFFNDDKSKIMGEICKYMASKKKVYRKVGDDELQKISDTVHHGGIVAVINTPRMLDIDETVIKRWLKEEAKIIVLDGIANSHNLGAIIRSAAFLGYSEIVLCDLKEQARITPSTYRIAEGGMEFVNLYKVPSIPVFLDKIKHGYFIIGTSLKAQKAINKDLVINNNKKPLALVMGNEEEGISNQTEKKCHMLLKIAGTGNVESLNVTAAATVFMQYLKDTVSF